MRCCRGAGVVVVAARADVGRWGHMVACVVRSLSQADQALLGERGAPRAAPGRLGIVMSSVKATGDR